MPRTPKPAKEYPASYFRILEFFSSGKEEIRVDLSYNQAVSRRQHFYRFFRALAKDYSSDPYMARMSEIANTIVISIHPTTAKKSDPVELVLTINPLELIFGNKPKPDKPITTGGEGAYDPSEIERIIAEREENNEPKDD